MDLAVRTAIALNLEVQPRSSFDRKHYFYLDVLESIALGRVGKIKKSVYDEDSVG